MLFKDVFDRFVAESPICVMARGLMERALAAQSLNAVFEKTAQHQYTRELLFSTTVDVMALVVCRVRPSVNAAYQARKEQIGVTVRALYDKLECMEPGISAALVRHTAARLEPIIRRMKGTKPPLLYGYKVKILDGNHLASTERRPKILRDVAAGCLPGQTLVVLEPETGLASDVICCEDGHTQERKLLDLIWSMVEERDLWIADRNFARRSFCLVWRLGKPVSSYGNTLRRCGGNARASDGVRAEPRPASCMSGPCGWRTKRATKSKCGKSSWCWISRRATARRRFGC